LATYAVAITPPPPARFSITTGLPIRSCSFGAIARRITSILPPGGNGTTKVIGPDGKSCAQAGAAAMKRAPTPTNSSDRRITMGTPRGPLQRTCGRGG
jgi:hypothetical protein